MVSYKQYYKNYNIYTVYYKLYFIENIDKKLKKKIL